MNPINKFMAILEDQVGYLEKKSNSQLDDKTANAGSNNFTKYARDLDALNYYNGHKNGYAWCCILPDWARVQVFGMGNALKMVGQKQGGLGAGVKYMAQYYQSMGRLYFTSPQRGDQIIFVTRDSKGNIKSWQHTGIVDRVENGRVYTIEGNTSSASGVVANGGGVFRKSYLIGSKSIYGYGRPNWSLVKEKEEPIVNNNIPADWAKTSWDKAKAKGVMDGTRPADNITRQEVAVILDRLGLLG